MRVLFISNFFPPARPGGYTQWCEEVAELLIARGHTVAVLTSNYELSKCSSSDKHIYRQLHLDGDLFYYDIWHFFLKRPVQIKQNIQIVQKAIQDFSPDIVFVWGMWALSKRIAWAAEQISKGRVVYYISDYWPIREDFHRQYWQLPARHKISRFVKGILKPFAERSIAKEYMFMPRFENVICVSAAVRDILQSQSQVFSQARVIHGGTRMSFYTADAPKQFARDVTKVTLLYAGQIVEHKGVHTLVEAIDKLVNQDHVINIALTIVGSGHPDYEKRIIDMINQANLSSFVQIRPAVPKNEMVKVLDEHEILIFPSIYEEPLARMTQEAMLAGLVVVGTTTGGTKEMLRDGFNGLTFEAANAAQLADKILFLLKNKNLLPQLSEAGRKTIVEHFALDRMVDEIESYLMQVEEKAR
jgi:glycosyltransferase involved in cell wall biosynthesis